MMVHNTFIIDSDARAGVQLAALLDDFCPYISVVGQYTSFAGALVEFELRKPRLIFLNKELYTEQNLFVFDHLKEAGALLIFITRTKESNVDIEELAYPYSTRQTLEEITKITRRNKVLLERNTVRTELKGAGEDRNFLTIASSDCIDLIHLHELLYCKADGKYTRFFLNSGKRIIASKNIGEFENFLGARNFFRIHQSYMVNIASVLRISKKDGVYCELADGTAVPIAARRQEEFFRFLALK